MIPAGLLLCIALIGYSFAGYPLLMGVLAWLHPRPRRWQAAPAGLAAQQGLSVVLCVHNAQGVIRRRLENLLACRWEGPLEILVVCDGCTDGTVREIEGLGAPQVRVLVADQRRGKPAGLNLAVPQCAHEVVVLADARQSFDPEALQKLAAPFAAPEVGAVSGLLEISASATGGGRGIDLYWRLETRLRTSEGRYDSVIGCTGAICAIRRSLYEALPEDTLLDDVVIPMRILCQDYRVVYEPEARAFDPQKLEPEKEKKRKLRTLVGNFQMLERYPGWLLPWRNRLWWQLISHKYLRLLVPWLMLAVLGLSLAWAGQGLVGGLLALQVLFYTAGALGALGWVRGSRLLGVAAGFLMLQASCFLAFFAYLRHRGNLIALWQPSAPPPPSPPRP